MTARILLLTALLSAPCFGAEQRYWRLTYNPSNHRQYYQSIIPGQFGYWWRHGEAHGPGPRGSDQWLSSNPNTLDPWARPAGCNGLQGDRLEISRTLKVPEDSYIEAWRTIQDENGIDGNAQLVVNGQLRGRFRRPKWHWRYPVGTIVEEQLFYDGKMFADRARTKIDETNWEPTTSDVLFEPPGYREVTRDCIECHKDAGRNVTRLTGHFPGREWYGDLRGDDTVFSFRPVNLSGKVNPEWERFVRIVSQPSTTATVP